MSSSSPRVALSSLKLPDVNHDEAKSSPNHAISAIQRWYRNYRKRVIMKNKIENSKENLAAALSFVDGLGTSSSFESTQRELFGENFNKSLQSVVELLPYKLRNTSSKALYAFRLKAKKTTASALIISKFPQNILFTEDSPEQQSVITKQCLQKAILLKRALRKFLYSVTKTTKMREVENNFQSFVYALHLFTLTFEKWQVEDRARIVKSLEDSFLEAYSAYIACKAAVLFQNTDPVMLHTAEHQLDKIRDVMMELIGGQDCVNRIEELCAAVEVSMPVYAQMKAYEDSVNNQQRSPSPSSPVPSSPSATRTTSAGTATGTATRTAPLTPNRTSSLVQSVMSPSMQQQEPIVLDKSDVTAMKYLEKLSQLTGMDSEHLAYEMTLDKYYRLPINRPTLDSSEVGHTSSNSSSSNSSSSPRIAADAPTTTVALLLRQQILQSMADKMVNSLKVSTVNDISELAVDMIVPLRFAPNAYNFKPLSDEAATATSANSSDASSSANAAAAAGLLSVKEQAAANPPVLSACIKAIHCVTLQSKVGDDIIEVGKDRGSFLDAKSPPRVASPPIDGPISVRAIHSHAAVIQHAISKSQVVELKRRKSSPALFDFSSHVNDIALDVEYIYENNMKEQGVSASRVKLASHGIDASHFLSALSDLCYQIAAFTPNRHDLINNLFTAVDFVLLKQMIESGGCNPVTDLLPVLQYLQRALMELQAPSRFASTQSWMDELSASFYEPQTSIAHSSSTGSLSGVQGSTLTVGAASSTSDSNSNSERKSKSFQDVVPLLPRFFEQASDCIEEIQRDMANFYISALVPMMQRHGTQFISRRFQQRLLQGEVTLDATASLLLSQINTQTALTATVADIVEAAVCGSEGFTLSDLVVVVVPTPIASATGSPTVEGSANASSTASGVATVTANNAGHISRQKQLARAVTARAFLTLLQIPIRLDSHQAMASKVLPETLVLDAGRLAAIRDYVDKIALESAIAITTRQLLSRYKVTFKESEEVELQHRLDVLLTEKDTNLASITVEVVKYVKYALFRHREVAGNWRFNQLGSQTPPIPSAILSDPRHSPLPPNMPISSPGSAGRKTLGGVIATAAASLSIAKPMVYASANSAEATQRGLLSPVTTAVAVNYDLKELQERVERTVKDVIAPGNAVLTLFTKRVYKILLRVMLGQPYKDKLQSYSLQSKGQERNLTQCMDSVTKVFAHSYAIHGELYAAILNTHAVAATTAGVVESVSTA